MTKENKIGLICICIAAFVIGNIFFWTIRTDHPLCEKWAIEAFNHSKVTDGYMNCEMNYWEKIGELYKVHMSAIKVDKPWEKSDIRFYFDKKGKLIKEQ